MSDTRAIIRQCVHCGFCNATCPTYLLLGDELDSPRGRIVLIKDMLATAAPPAASTVKHIDRCLSCLSCTTTCPSGVDYHHLIDRARDHIEANYRRPPGERLVRWLVATVLPRRALFRASARLAGLARPFAGLLPPRIAAMIAAAPARLPPPGIAERGGVHPALCPRIARVALLSGCVQPALAPSIDDAAIRLLTRHGIEVIVARAGCCGALARHMGHADAARADARANIAAWETEVARGLDAIVVTTSGCGTAIKEYGQLFADDAEWGARAARIAALARDITEVMAGVVLRPPVIAPGTIVAYHSACSLQHGQKVSSPPRALLAAVGFVVHEIGEGHICCGSAGTYSLLQPELSRALRDRKLGHIARTGARVVATGNIGCINQLQSDGVTMVHTVELLDWATGGPRPAGV